MAFNSKEYIKQYAKENIVSVICKMDKRTEADMLAHLAKQPNRQGYIKSLIRQDMARTAEHSSGDVMQ